MSLSTISSLPSNTYCNGHDLFFKSTSLLFFFFVKSDYLPWIWLSMAWLLFSILSLISSLLHTLGNWCGWMKSYHSLGTNICGQGFDLCAEFVYKLALAYSIDVNRSRFRWARLIVWRNLFSLKTWWNMQRCTFLFFSRFKPCVSFQLTFISTWDLLLFLSGIKRPS